MDFINGEDVNAVLDFAEKIWFLDYSDPEWLSVTIKDLRAQFLPRNKLRETQDLLNIAKDYLFKINNNRNWLSKYFDGGPEAVYQNLVFSGEELNKTRYGRVFEAVVALNKLADIYTKEERPEVVFNELNRALQDNENLILQIDEYLE